MSIVVRSMCDSNGSAFCIARRRRPWTKTNALDRLFVPRNVLSSVVTPCPCASYFPTSFATWNHRGSTRLWRHRHSVRGQSKRSPETDSDSSCLFGRSMGDSLPAIPSPRRGSASRRVPGFSALPSQPSAIHQRVAGLNGRDRAFGLTRRDAVLLFGLYR